MGCLPLRATRPTGPASLHYTSLHFTSLRSANPPPQVRHFLAWLLHRVRGGVPSEKELSKREAERFKAGMVRMERNASPTSMDSEGDDSEG